MGFVALHVRVTGHVQGVFFRAWAQQQANALGVTGWIRNCPGGRVEAHVEGQKDAVSTMVERLRQGPPDARVDDVTLWDVNACEFDDFEVRH